MKTIVILLTLCGEPTGVILKADGQWLVGTPEAAFNARFEAIRDADERVKVELSDVFGRVCA